MKDLQEEGDGVYAPQRKEEEEHFPTQLVTRSLMQEFY